MRITSGYGPRRIVVGGKARNWPHRGVDARSPRGAAVRALFGGRVVKTATGRTAGAPIGRTDPDTGAAPLASSVSGNGTVIARDGGGYYVEVHMDPAVKVGNRVEVGDVIGHTDLSGQITGAHRHIELWRRFDPETHYDPTTEVLAAASGKGTSTPTPEPEDDMFTPEHADALAATATRVTYMREKQLPAIHQEVVDRANLVSTAAARRDAALQAQITTLARVVAAGSDLDVPALLAEVEEAAERGTAAAIRSIDTTVTITKE